MNRALFLLPIALLVGCADPTPGGPPSAPNAAELPAATDLAIADAYLPAAPGGGTTALFAEITGGTDADSLVAAAFAGAERAEVHESTADGDGMRGMRAVPAAPVPAGGALSLRPGGVHVMLIGLDRDLMAGDSVDVDLTFARAGTRTVRAGVRGLDGMPGHTP